MNVCKKIAIELNSPNDKIIKMFLANNHGYFSGMIVWPLQMLQITVSTFLLSSFSLDLGNCLDYSPANDKKFNEFYAVHEGPLFHGNTQRLIWFLSSALGTFLHKADDASLGVVGAFHSCSSTLFCFKSKTDFN
ncbi:hypothetical protein RJ641_016864, partial [Dillenia turbinata]